MTLALFMIGMNAACAGRQGSPADSVLNRYVDFRKKNPSYEANFTILVNKTPLNAHFALDGKSRLVSTVKAVGLDYSIAITTDKVLEIDRVGRKYDEYGVRGPISIPKSRISMVTNYLPGWVFATDLKELIPRTAKYAVRAQETDLRVTCDVVKATYKTQMGDVSIEAAIDPDGKVLRLQRTVSSPGGENKYEWSLNSIEPASSADPAKFRLELPLGFSPFAVDEATGPIQVGNSIPLTGWTTNTGRKLDLGTRLGKSGGLIAVLSSDSSPSKRAQISLQRLHAVMPVVTVSDAPSRSPFTDAYDPTGNLVSQISPPDTPLFLLVDGTGKVTRLWMGYDSERASDFEKDIRNAYQAK